MASRLKKIGIALGIILILFLIVGVLANPFLENKIKSTLEKSVAKAYHLKYDKVSASIWLGDVSISGMRLRKDSSDINIKAIHLKGVNWLTYLKTKQLKFNTLKVIQPDFKYVENTKLFDAKASGDSLKSKQKSISIDKISIENAKFTKLDSTAKISTHHFNTVNIQLKDFVIDSMSRKSQLPFKYSSVHIDIDSIFTLAGKFETIQAKNFELNNETISIENIGFQTKYPKAKYHQLLKKERDHYNISIDSIRLNEWNYAYKSDSLSFTTSHLRLHQPKANIYRNKLITDDTSQKQFYGEALRSLPFYLEIEKLSIHNAELRYREKVLPDHPSGKLNFSNINAEVLNLENIEGDKPTDIKIKAKFMNSASLNIDWQFWVNEKDEKFTFKAQLDELAAHKINSFTKANLNIGFSGNIKQTYFSIFGDKYSSKIDMQMEYDEFKVELLKKDSSEVNTIKSAIVNLFISKKSKNNSETYRKVSAEAKPDRTKSIFNYLWKNVKIALLKIFKG